MSTILSPPPSQQVPATLEDPTLRQNIDLLEDTFNRIYRERMQDVPIINNKISVKVIGMQKWQEFYLGILLTPWFMNLILLPGNGENWEMLEELSKQSFNFPSGRYTFITGFESALGKYRMCSLFSPMFDFADNEAAVETAEFAIRELLKADNVEDIDSESQQIEDIWNGNLSKAADSISEDIEQLSEPDKQKIIDQPSLAEKLERPMSRRELLRGALMRKDDEA